MNDKIISLSMELLDLMEEEEWNIITDHETIKLENRLHQYKKYLIREGYIMRDIPMNELFISPKCNGKIELAFNNVIGFLDSSSKGSIAIVCGTEKSREQLTARIGSYLEERDIDYSLKSEPSQTGIDNVIITVGSAKAVLIILPMEG